MLVLSQYAEFRSGVDIDEVVSILGEDWFMTTVWGSAFEEFLTRDFEDGTIVHGMQLNLISPSERITARRLACEAANRLVEAAVNNLRANREQYLECSRPRPKP
jgi:hypothetical protein